jgi:hypothetical protein
MLTEYHDGQAKSTCPENLAMFIGNIHHIVNPAPFEFPAVLQDSRIMLFRSYSIAYCAIIMKFSRERRV